MLDTNSVNINTSCDPFKQHIILYVTYCVMKGHKEKEIFGKIARMTHYNNSKFMSKELKIMWF